MMYREVSVFKVTPTTDIRPYIRQVSKLNMMLQALIVSLPKQISSAFATLGKATTTDA
jgi:hypothetical protein